MKPTRARSTVLWFAIVLVVITYIDRVCISNFRPFIAKDLNLSNTEMGMVFSAFALSYALFEIPTGWLGDMYGPRKTLLRIVVWWSFFTAATGWAWNRTSLVVTRFLFGIGEAGAFPNLTKVLTMWMPVNERVKAQGIMWMAARWGGAFTGSLVLLVMQFMTWRQAFQFFGVLGILWAIAFYRWFRDHPKDHPSVNAAELAEIGETTNITGDHHVPWGRFASSGSIWLMWLAYFCVSYGWYFYITWLPTYLRDVRKMDFGASTVLSGLPLFLGGIGCLVSGYLTPMLSARFRSERTGRRTIAIVGTLGASAMLVFSTGIENPYLALLAIAVASFFNDLVMPPAWGACMDIGGKFAGTLSGSMNMMGNLAGAVAPLIIGTLIDITGSNWDLTFYISAAIYLVAAVCWYFLDPVTPLDGTLRVTAPEALKGGLGAEA
jgi:ACS family glucarate transporter-like MFS transporter